MLPQSGSLAFKRNQPIEIYRTYIPPEYSPQVYESFILVRRANDGDPLAQHELGLRYLTGNGFEIDTAKAFIWVERASRQKYPLAAYNTGIFYMNGWGTSWNPVKAFENFLLAAEKDVPEAQFAVGVIYTEDLIVKKDLDKAKYWFQQAEKSGNDNATNALLAVEKDILAAKEKRSQDELAGSNPISKNVTLQYIDFTKNKYTQPADSLLLVDFYEELGRTATAYQSFVTRAVTFTDSVVQSFLLVEQTIEKYSFPEGLLLLGRIHETGRGVPVNLNKAAYYYVRALKEGAPYAGIFLWELVNREQLFSALYARINKGDNNAAYTLSTLRLLKLEFKISEKDALLILEKAANNGNLPALIEYGNILFNGIFVPVNRAAAKEVWEKAESAGAYQAKLRLFISSIAEGSSTGFPSYDLYSHLQEGYRNGSLLAETVLGYYYEKGLSGDASKSNAYRIYRNAASRGSNLAYTLLKNLYQDI